MKKLIMAVIAAAIIAPMFISCKKGACECYKVKYTIPAQSEQKDSTGTVTREARTEFKYEGYKWMRSEDVSVWKESLEKLNYTDIDATKEDKFKTESDCLSQEHILIN